jgi:hypothetical protein
MSAEIRSAFDRLLQAQELPAAECFLALGSALSRSHLRHLPKELEGHHYAASVLRGLLGAAARQSNEPHIDDRGHVCKLLSEIAAGNHWHAVQGELAKFAKQVDVEMADRVPVNHEASANPATIFWYGEKKYGLGNAPPMVVTEREDAVLTAFLDHTSMGYQDLVKRASDGARGVLRDLKTKYEGMFASAITLPGAKGNGGYRVNIRKA